MTLLLGFIAVTALLVAVLPAMLRTGDSVGERREGRVDDGVLGANVGGVVVRFAPPPSAASQRPRWLSGEPVSILALEAGIHREFGIPYDADGARVRLRDEVQWLRSQMDANAGSGSLAVRVGRLLFSGNSRFRFLDPYAGHRVFTLSGALRERMGNCLALSCLYVAVLEELNIDASVVLKPYPGHAVVAIQDQFFDPTRQFGQLKDAAVLSWRGVGVGDRFGRPLSKPELAGVLLDSLAWTRMVELDGEYESVRLGDLQRMFELSLAITPYDESALIGMASLCSANGRYDLSRAVAYAEAGVSVNPLSPAGLIVSALLYERTGRTAAAAVFRRRGLELSRHHPWTESASLR